MKKQEIIDRINNINPETLSHAINAIQRSNPINALTKNLVLVTWHHIQSKGYRYVTIEPKSKATKENLLTVYYAVLDEIVCQYGLEAIREIDAEYVPDCWEDADIYTRMKNNLNARDNRGAWENGVNEYALELVDELRERAEYEGRNPEPGKECREWMLNGAQDWRQYSWGGSGLIYNSDIAERLCCPSELKKTRGGERRPNSREEWLDTQARALTQAACLVSGIYSRILRGGGCR